VRLDPAKVDSQSAPTPIAALSPAPVAGGKSAVPAGPTPPLPSEATFAPHDECAAQPGWKAFRDKLGSAVSSQNAAALAALATRTDLEAFQELLGLSQYVGECVGESARSLAEHGSWSQVAEATGTSKQAVWSRWRG